MLDGPHCVESMLLQGVGHTIDFANRNNLLTDAFQYLKSTTCGATSTVDNDLEKVKLMSQNTYKVGNQILLESIYMKEDFTILNINGELISSAKGSSLQLPNIAGQYILITQTGLSEQFVIVE